MVFNAIFNNISVTSISWWSVLLVEETGVPGENSVLPQITDKFMTYSCIEYISSDRDSNSQR